MKIQVIYFQSLKKTVGRGEETIEWDRSDATVADLMTMLKSREPAVAAMERSLLVAVNEEHARPDRVLNDGDVVALMPPFSGG